MKSFMKKYFEVETVGAASTRYIPKAGYVVVLGDVHMVDVIEFRYFEEYWVTYKGIKNHSSYSVYEDLGDLESYLVAYKKVGK